MERQIKAGSGFRSHKALYWLAGSLIVLAVAGQILILRGVVFRHRLAAFERESQWLLTVGDRLLNGYLEVQQARLEYLTATAARPDIKTAPDASKPPPADPFETSPEMLAILQFRGSRIIRAEGPLAQGLSEAPQAAARLLEHLNDREGESSVFSLGAALSDRPRQVLAVRLADERAGASAGGADFVFLLDFDLAGRRLFKDLRPGRNGFLALAGLRQDGLVVLADTAEGDRMIKDLAGTMATSRSLENLSGQYGEVLVESRKSSGSGLAVLAAVYEEDLEASWPETLYWSAILAAVLIPAALIGIRIIRLVTKPVEKTGL